MKIVVAPNALKGSLSAVEAARAMSDGAKAEAPDCEVILVPVSDGGDGLAEVLRDVLDGTHRPVTVYGPRGDLVEAGYLLSSDARTAVVEMSTASGLAALSGPLRDPTVTSTFGTGELMADALSLGVQRLLVGVGGSATCDGGTGTAAALGVEFLDAKGRLVEPVGGKLGDIESIDLSRRHPMIVSTTIEVVCDVRNPLLGDNGAARMYAPQKGATPEQVELLERGMANLAGVVKRELSIDIAQIPHGGAAGGLAAGLYAFCGAALCDGAETVLDLVAFKDKLDGADLVLTSEGCIDEQTLFGKAPAAVAQLAAAGSVPCIAVAGRCEADRHRLRDGGFSSVYTLCNSSTDTAAAMKNAAGLLKDVTAQAVRDFAA